MLLIRWIKEHIIKLFSDAHSGIIGTIVSLVSIGSIYTFCRYFANASLSILKSPTPLWVTILLVLVVLLYTYLKAYRVTPFLHTNIFPKKIKLTEIQEKILIRLYDGGLAPNHISNFLSIPYTLAVFHFNELYDLGLIDTPGAYSTTNLWSISQEGTRYLINRKLIK